MKVSPFFFLVDLTFAVAALSIGIALLAIAFPLLALPSAVVTLLALIRVARPTLAAALLV